MRGRGEWIWDAFHRETPNQLMLLRRVVQLERPVSDAAVRVAARGSFRVWVNGSAIGHHDLQSPVPGAESIPIDLAAALPAGTTRIELIIGVHSLAVGTHHQPRALGGLHVTGAARDADGGVVPFDSGAEWETHAPGFWRQSSPQMVWSAGYTEWWDRTASPSDVPGASAQGTWSPAVSYPDAQIPDAYERAVVEQPLDLLPYRVEFGRTSAPAGDFPTRAAECVAAGADRVAAARGAHDGGWAYDLFELEHEDVGFLEIELDVDEPCTIDVIYGERRDAAGWPTATRQGIDAIDTIVIPAGVTAHRFWNRRAFRALAVIVRSAGRRELRRAVFHTVTARREPAVFRSGDERYDRMHAISASTAAVGRQDYYEDCPLREGGHYVADARVQALLDLATTGETALARRSLVHFADAQDADGMVPALSPSGTRHRIPDFSLQWISYLDDYVRFTGDVELLIEMTPALRRVIAWAIAQWDDAAGAFDGGRPGWWTFIDWFDFTPAARQAALDAQYAASLVAASELLLRLGDVEGAREVQAHAEAALMRMGAPIRHPHAAVVLWCGLSRERARALVAPDALDGFVADTGYENFWLCIAHIRAGRADEAWRILTVYWGAMQDAGARTWWELFALDHDVTETSRASLCHPWSAGPLVLLPMLLGGIDPYARPDGRRFEPVDLGRRILLKLHTPEGVVATSPATPAL
jgi:hypothetical protein